MVRYLVAGNPSIIDKYLLAGKFGIAVVAKKLCVKSFSVGFVGNKDIGGLQTGQIKGFAGGSADDTVLSSFFTKLLAEHCWLLSQRSMQITRDTGARLSVV